MRHRPPLRIYQPPEDREDSQNVEALRAAVVILSTLVVALLLFGVIGCAPSPSRRDAPTPAPKPTPVISDLAAEVAAARKASAAKLAEQLEQLAADIDAGKLKYDAKLRQRIEQAQSDAYRPLAEIVGKLGSDGALADPKCADKVRDLAHGYRSP